jgi:hypothetical protein
VPSWVLYGVLYGVPSWVLYGVLYGVPSWVLYGYSMACSLPPRGS